MTQHVALFDMDRTLVRVETASLYVRYQREIGEASLVDSLRVAWWATLYTFNLLDAPRVAQRALAQLKGTSEVVLASRCDDWFRRYVERHISDEARRTVSLHKNQGNVLAIVTGATPYTAYPVARALDIPHVVGSPLEIVNGLFTGRPEQPLCYGKGKLERARCFVESLGMTLNDATFYSDSITDLPLLSAVHTPVVVNPDPKLRLEAKKRGWRIERW